MFSLQIIFKPCLPVFYSIFVQNSTILVCIFTLHCTEAEVLECALSKHTREFKQAWYTKDKIFYTLIYIYI